MEWRYFAVRGAARKEGGVAMESKKENVRRAGGFPASCLFAPVALVIALSLGFLSTSLPARAQDSGAPARAVRLSFVDGTVHLSQGNQIVTDQAVANTPLLEGMTLATGDDGRAEIQFEDGSVARLSPDSALTLKVLSGQGSSAQAEVDVNGGLAYFELQGTGQVGPINVRFGDSMVTTSGFTVMRVKDDTPPGELAVFSGNAHLQRDSGLAVDIHGGESVALSATDANGYNLAESIEPDSWDTWNSDRDQELNAEAAAQTSAPTDINGAQQSTPAWNDLDANGTWYNVPDQGYVWSPYDASNADFDPYGNGDWEWTPGFGYTWVSGYSWGYLPYQCGAWNFYNGFGWGWAPGFGGCNPWWRMGFYGGPNIGYAPGWYHRVERPVRPAGPRPGHPVPVIPIHRRLPVLTAGLPPRDHNAPITINGHSVMPVRTLPARGIVARGAFGQSANPMPSPVRPVPRPSFVPMRPVYTPVPRPEGAPGMNPGQRNTFAPPIRPTEPMRTYTPPAPARTYTPPEPARTYTPPAPSRPYSPPPSRPSGGNSRPSGGDGYHGGGNSGGGGGYHGGGGSGGGGGHSGGGGGHSGGGGGGGHSGGGGGGGGRR